MAKLWIDKYVFRWIKKELSDATPDKIVAFYVEKFVFHNEGYLEFLQQEYNLPDDLLKLHKRIIELA